MSVYDNVRTITDDSLSLVTTRVSTPDYCRVSSSDRPSTRAKLALDVLIASVALLVLLPVLVLLALAVSLDGGPIFYTQHRVGRGGRLFACLKFRSMVMDNDSILAEFLAANRVQAIAWNANRKLQNDPRVTRVGRFIRQTSLDELPQLFNVLKLEMSLVGPRPIMQDEIALYGEHLEKYYNFRPGLTGLWQISGRSVTTFRDRVQFDIVYAETWSFWRDLAIIGRTVPVVLRRSGAC